MYPTQLITLAVDDDVTVKASNARGTRPYPTFSPHTAFLASRPRHIEIDPTDGIADTGATSIFIQQGVPVPNLQVTVRPLTVNLPDGKQVRSTHTCDVNVPGLPKPLIGQVIPDLAMASLFGIRPLCNAGCVVVFHKDRVEVRYKGNIILIGQRNPSTELWTLPIAPRMNPV